MLRDFSVLKKKSISLISGTVENWQFLVKLNMQLPYNAEIALLGIHTRDTKTYVYA